METNQDHGSHCRRHESNIMMVTYYYTYLRFVYSMKPL